jgi:hypothetical protein
MRSNFKERTFTKKAKTPPCLSHPEKWLIGCHYSLLGCAKTLLQRSEGRREGINHSIRTP